MGFKRLVAFFLIILALGFLSFYYPKLTGEATSQEIQVQEYPKEPAILERVVDGDTIEARVNNETWKIRLLGINTPEKKMPFSNESKAFLQQFENKTIYLQRDWEDEDKYYRKLRYLFFEERLLNKEILEKGFANTYYISGLKYAQDLIQAEKNAKAAELGIWTKSKEDCSASSCINLKELNAQEESFVLINQCDFSCALEGWFVKDAGRNVFYLSSLNPGEEKAYNSKEGKDVWNDGGDRFYLFDKSGFLVLFYEY